MRGLGKRQWLLLEALERLEQPSAPGHHVHIRAVVREALEFKLRTEVGEPEEGIRAEKNWLQDNLSHSFASLESRGLVWRSAKLGSRSTVALTAAGRSALADRLRVVLDLAHAPVTSSLRPAWGRPRDEADPEMTNKVTIYRFDYWDGPHDCWQQSNVWGTAEAIAATKIGVIDSASGIEIDPKHLDARGMTGRGFDPRSVLLAGGFPNRMRP